MTTLIFLIYISLFCFLMGSLVQDVMGPLGLKHERFITIPLGFGVIALVATLGYRFGASLAQVNLWLTAACGIKVFWQISRPSLSRLLNQVFAKQNRDSTFGEAKKTLIVNVALYLAVLAYLLFPEVIGGRQFTVFQGNIWDTFGYLGTAVGVSHFSYGELVAVDKSGAVVNPLMTWAAGNLRGRPSAMILFATLVKPFGRYFFSLYYPFCCFLLAQVFFAFGFFLTNVLGLALSHSFIIGGCFVFGFWGQYIFDIDALSQLSGIALFMAWAALLIIAQRPHEGRRSVKSLTLTACVIGIAGIYLYPENWLVHAAFLTALTAFNVIYKKSREGWQVLATAVLISLASGFIFKEGVIDWMLGATHGAHDQVLNANAPYFQMFIKRHTIAANGFLTVANDFVLGLTGFYFFSPAPSLPRLLSSPLRLLGIAFAVYLLGPYFKKIWFTLRERALDDLGRFYIFVGLFLAGAGYFFAGQYFWSGGKLLSYGSPYLVMALMVAFFDGARPAQLKKVIFYIFIMAQAGFSLVREFGAGRHDGIALQPPYPFIAHAEDKTGIRWSDHSIMPAIEKCRGVHIHIADRWVSNYIMILAQSVNVPFSSDYPVWRYLNAVDVGVVPPVTADCLIVAGKTERGELTIELQNLAGVER